MNTATAATIAQIACTAIVFTWLVAAVTLQLARTAGRTAPDPARHLFHELRPFFIPAVIASFVLVTVTTGARGWDWFNLAMNTVNWHFLRNAGDDDDRWKRRRRRLAERVEATGGRLAVVPEATR